VRSVAQRDSIFNSIPDKKRTKLVNAALSFTSGEVVKELRHFLNDICVTGTENRENLVRDVGRVKR
jgi:hypothetical protein